MNALLAAALAAHLASGASSSAQDPAAQDPDQAPDQTIIVTGTRFSGLRATDSPEPVQVVTSDALRTAGPPSLGEALSRLVPSFNTQAVGNDLANETLAARLRGV
jgi:iron complex outermembrane receptor protein